MRYAIFTDIHANLEALTAVLAKIDELAEQEPIDSIWFLGDLVGYGPNPNECIAELRKRTDVIIAGNHDWAAVGKIDLEDFSSAARTSAEWTSEQLTEEHRTFLSNLPERIEHEDFTLVHGSPYGPLWEYLTSEVLAERSFEYFSSRYCIVGHTHVPVIFQQPDTIPQTPTAPLNGTNEEEEETQKIVAVSATRMADSGTSTSSDSAFVEKDTLDTEDSKDKEDSKDAVDSKVEVDAEKQANVQDEDSEDSQVATDAAAKEALAETLAESAENAGPVAGEIAVLVSDEEIKTDEDSTSAQGQEEQETQEVQEVEQEEAQQEASSNGHKREEVAPLEHIASVEDRLNSEIAELLELLGLSQSMVKVTNEMLIPPEGAWSAPAGYRAIVNPGGVGQPRDGDPRAAFMIYDTDRGFTFYRVHYDYEKTQEKILEAGLPTYLATRLGYGR